MLQCICFKCGADKTGVLAKCSCGATPLYESDVAISLVLSEHLSARSKLSQYAQELRRNLTLSIPDELLMEARDALSDQQLMALIKSQQPATPPASRPSTTSGSPSRPAPLAEVVGTWRRRPRLPVSASCPAPSAARAGTPKIPRTLTRSSIHTNPFAVLGATTRDDRRRIVELADEKALQLDHDVCQKARADLTNPRVRLSAELAWLPGLSPKKTSALMATIEKDTLSIRAEAGLPALAHANLMAAAFGAINSDDQASDVAKFIQELADLVEVLSAEDVLRDINEDRSISGFPQLQNVEQVEVEMKERKRYYRDAVREALNRLPPTVLVAAMTSAVDEATDNGDCHAPELIDELIDAYAVETQGFLDQEAENIFKLIESARNSVHRGERVVEPVIDKLSAAAKNWDSVAQPIQLSAKARGIDHDASQKIAYAIRSLAVDLFNEHDMLAQSRRLTELSQELFAELPEFAERVDGDAVALDEIEVNRKRSAAEREQFEKLFTYRAEVGVVKKRVLSISPAGVTWDGKTYPLESVTRIRWGGTRHDVHGFRYTTYTIGFGDRNSEAVVELRREETYSRFVECLWRAVGVRLIIDTVKQLKAGRTVEFGGISFRDDSVVLMKAKFFSNEPVRCQWSDIRIGNSDGSFCLASAADKKVTVSFSFIHIANTHVLEHIVSTAFKKPGMKKLSEAFDFDD
jgi:hypothetical protein